MKAILCALLFFISQAAFAEDAGTKFIASLKALETKDWNPPSSDGFTQCSNLITG